MTKTKIRTQQQQGYTELKILIQHPMQNGRNRDTVSGQLIPAHFIQELQIELNGNTVINAALGPSLSKNPFFTFRLQAAAGDQLKLRWLDNLGFSDSIQHIIE